MSAGAARSGSPDAGAAAARGADRRRPRSPRGSAGGTPMRVGRAVRMPACNVLVVGRRAGDPCPRRHRGSGPDGRDGDLPVHPRRYADRCARNPVPGGSQRGRDHRRNGGIPVGVRRTPCPPSIQQVRLESGYGHRRCLTSCARSSTTTVVVSSLAVGGGATIVRPRSGAAFAAPTRTGPAGHLMTTPPGVSAARASGIHSVERTTEQGNLPHARTGPQACRRRPRAPGDRAGAGRAVRGRRRRVVGGVLPEFGSA